MVRITARPRDSLDDDEVTPEFLLVHDTPRHIWFDGEHFVETDDRRAEPGKCYLDPNGEQLFQRVVEITVGDAPVPVDDVEDGSDEVTVEILYATGNDQPIPEEPMTEAVPRYVLETEEGINMGDATMIPFVRE